MFQSIKCLRYLGYDKKTKEYSYEYEYELTDSEFGTVKGAGSDAVSGAGASALVIKTYEEKGLSVPENFAHYIRYINSEHGKYGYTKKWMLDWHSTHNKLFPKYKDEILKALDKLETEEKANTHKLSDSSTSVAKLKDVPIGTEVSLNGYSENATVIGHYGNGSTVLAWKANPNKRFHWELRGSSVAALEHKAFAKNSRKFLQDTSHLHYGFVASGNRECQIAAEPKKLQAPEEKVPLKDLPMGSEVMVDGQKAKQTRPTFKSIEYLGYKGYNKTTKLHEYNYKIVDEGFEWSGAAADVSAGVYASTGADVSAGAALISCYEEKGLPVPENFAAYIQFIDSKWAKSGYTIDWMIAHYSAHNPKFAKYKDEVLKILGKAPIQQASSALQEAKTMKLIDVSVGSEIELDGVKATIIARNLSHKSTLLAWKNKTEAPTIASHPWSQTTSFNGKVPAHNHTDTYAHIANEEEWNNATGIWVYESDQQVKVLRNGHPTGFSGTLSALSLQQAQRALSDLYKDTMNDEIKAQTQSVKEASETIKTATRSIEEIAKSLREKKIEEKFAEVNDVVSRVIGTDTEDKRMMSSPLSIADLGKSPFQSARSPAKVAGSSSIGEEILKGLANQQAAASLKAQVEKAMKAVEDLEAQSKERERTLTKKTIAATKLAMQMQKTGLIQDYEFERQVENILTWNDHAFQMMKKTVEKLSIAPPATQITVIDGKSVAELKQTLSKVEETIKPTFTDTLKSEVKDAGYRIASTKLTSAVKTGILALLKSKGLDGSKIQVFSELLDTEIGGAFISELLGHGLPYIPHVKNDHRIQRLAEEFRIGGYTIIGNEVLGGLLEHVLPAITNVMKELPSDKEETVRVSEKIEETKTFEQSKEKVEEVPMTIDLTSTELEDAIRLEDEEAVAETQSMSG